MIEKIYSIFRVLILTLIFIVLSLVLLLLVKESLKKEVLDRTDRKQIEKYILEYINGGDDMLISDYSIKKNNFFMNFSDEFDVSPLITALIDHVTDSYREYLYWKSLEELDDATVYPYPYESNSWVNFKLIYSEYCMYKYFESINMERKLSIYKFKEYFIKELEKCIRHTSEKYQVGWYIKGTTTGVINLPYDFYIIFPGIKVEEVSNIKKVTKIEFTKDYIYNVRKDHWYYNTKVRKEYSPNLEAIMTYYDNENNIIKEELKSDAIWFEVSKTYKYDVDLDGIKYKIISPNDFYGKEYYKNLKLSECPIVINNYYVEKKYKEEEAIADYKVDIELLMTDNYLIYRGANDIYYITDPDVKKDFSEYLAENLEKDMKKIDNYFEEERKKIKVLKRGVDYE